MIFHVLYCLKKQQHLSIFATQHFPSDCTQSEVIIYKRKKKFSFFFQHNFFQRILIIQLFVASEIRHLVISGTGSCHFCLFLCEISLSISLLFSPWLLQGQILTKYHPLVLQQERDRLPGNVWLPGNHVRTPIAMLTGSPRKIAATSTHGYQGVTKLGYPLMRTMCSEIVENFFLAEQLGHHNFPCLIKKKVRT